MCVSPQYHCPFNDFVETTHHSAPAVSGTICWQQFTNLDYAKTALSKVSTPKQHSVISLETPSDEESHPMSKPIFEPNTIDTTSDDYSIPDLALQVSENSCTSQQNQVSHMADEVTPVEPTVTSGTSKHGQVCTMSKRMVESVSQWNFYEDQGIHYMASQATTGNTYEELFHDTHLQLQK
jgi:hypothetical protein